MSIDNIKYYNKVNCNFSEAVYKEMATERYGIQFPSEDSSQKYKIKKQLLDLNAIADVGLDAITIE